MCNCYQKVLPKSKYKTDRTLNTIKDIRVGVE